MPKRRRLLNDVNHKGDVVSAARGRLKGALMSAVDSNSDEDSSQEDIKHERTSSVKRDLNHELSGDDKKGSAKKRGIPPSKPNSYVMKLFDRSVDLAQFTEDTPLYPICRAWMANQPRNYGRPKTPDNEPEESDEKLVGLPPPEGQSLPKLPPLLPEQCQYLTEEISFDYRTHVPPSIDHLMKLHKARWGAIRKKWQQQSALYETRYAKTQALLKEMESRSSSPSSESKERNIVLVGLPGLQNPEGRKKRAPLSQPPSDILKTCPSQDHLLPRINEVTGL